MPRFSYSPAGEGRLPKYRRHKATGQAIVTLSGHDYYLGAYGTKVSKIEYDRLVAEWLAQGRQLPGSGTTDLTVVELCAAFWGHAKTYYVKDGRPTSTLGGIRRAIVPLRRFYGRTLAVEFGPTRLKALRHELLRFQLGGDGGGMA